eukprot:GILI01003043.1.p1 GENE.GILI01003043.1~~GILI01003043.1.p1  ORF type:complete len:988 (+),score=306.27 GILI01003043.1:355-2964(+)
MTMDVHGRYRTESHQDVEPRFNERFILSLSNCKHALVVDDELNVLPVASHSRSIAPVSVDPSEPSPAQTELSSLQLSLKETLPIGALLQKAKTLDQARAVMTFVDAISDRSLRSTVSLTAARGRGKSAALGIAVAGAIAYGYSNILVTAPAAENVGTLFNFIVVGLEALGYQEHMHYELVQSTNPDLNKAIVRVNIFKDHRQTIQYVSPSDAAITAYAELLVIDEAAAIPLPLVKKLLGPYLVFMASTITGYEGTGRSLSLKLLQQLRQQSAIANTNSGAKNRAAASESVSSSGSRVLREVELKQPIRYGEDDPVEKWLYDLLCLDATSPPRLLAGCPHPSQCELFYVNRDTLFSYHKASEEFLQRMMSLYVSSHYKNSPNDLQLMSDAPAHHLFVLLGPVPPDAKSLPDILAVVQVAIEGQISREAMQAAVSRGLRPSGDLIPWLVSEQFHDNEFGALNGARVVRIATHPDIQRMGYGSRALELLKRYYEGQLTGLDEPKDEAKSKKKKEAEAEEASGLLEERLKPRAGLRPLLQKLSERRPEPVQYLGVSFGLTQQLYDFWRRAKFAPVYVRQTPNDVTGEHTCVMLQPLDTDEVAGKDGNDWLASYVTDFKRRFLSLLAFDFSALRSKLALSVLEPRLTTSAEDAEDKALSKDQLDMFFSPFDLKRVEAYARSLTDYHSCMDLLPTISRLFFLRQLGTVSLSFAQACILLAMGLQHKTVDAISEELDIPASQALALFNKSINKFNTVFKSIQEQAISQSLPKPKRALPHSGELLSSSSSSSAADFQTLDEELAEGGKKVVKELKSKQSELLASLSLQEYAIGGTEQDWAEALKGGVKTSVSVKSQGKKNKREREEEDGGKKKKQRK